MRSLKKKFVFFSGVTAFLAAFLSHNIFAEKKKGVDEIYCLAVNDAAVMKAWQSQYLSDNKIIMIADGNGDLTKALELDQDYSSSFMGLRSKRFALLSEDNRITILNIEAPGQYKVSTPENLLNLV